MSALPSKQMLKFVCCICFWKGHIEYELECRSISRQEGRMLEEQSAYKRMAEFFRPVRSS